MADQVRISQLRLSIRSAAESARWQHGIRGLYLNLEFLRKCGASPRILTTWQQGRALSAAPAEPTERANHPSLTENGKLANLEWARLSDLGKVTLFAPGRPRPPRLNVNPCALIAKVREGVADDAPKHERLKVRLIVDLTRGLVNPRLPEVGVKYGTLELAVSRMKVGDYLFVLDLKDAFFNWRVEPNDTWELVFFMPTTRQYGKYDFLPQGLATAPGINDECVKELLRLLKETKDIDLVDFVDDLIGGANDYETAWAALVASVEFFLAAGVPVSDKPTGIRPPSQTQIWIGWEFDTVNGTVSVTESKCDKCRTACLDVLEADDARVLKARSLASCAGLASHVAEVYPQARRRLHPVWSDLNAAGVYSLWARTPSANPSVTLCEASRDSLCWFIGLLASPPRRLLHSNGGPLSSWGPRSPEFINWKSLAAAGSILVIETDASKLTGWSYHVCNSGRVVSGLWPRNFGEAEGLQHAEQINYKELWTVVRCLEQERALLQGWRVVFRVDNSAAVHYINVRYGRVSSLEALTAKLEDAERLAYCWALAVHVKGEHNVIADAGSRDALFATRWASDQFRDAALRSDLFRDIESRCGVVFTLDLFADRDGLNALAPNWRSPVLSAFEANLQGEVVWAHPPRNLLQATLRFFKATFCKNPGLQVVLLAPEDVAAPWFRQDLLTGWHRIRSWEAGSDIFRWVAGGPDRSSVRWRRGPRSDLPYHVLQSWAPRRRGNK